MKSQLLEYTRYVRYIVAAISPSLCLFCTRP